MWQAYFKHRILLRVCTLKNAYNWSRNFNLSLTRLETGFKLKMSSTDHLTKIVDGLEYPDKVKIKDVVATNAKISELIQNGTYALQVITDFDRTLTIQDHGILSRSPLMPESFKEIVQLRIKTWHNIEMDQNLSLEEKSAKLVEIIQDGRNKLSKLELTRGQVEKLVQAVDLVDLRDKTKEAFELLNDKEVPILIFSAGYGNFIEAIIRDHNISYPNIHIIANFMLFDNTNPIYNDQMLIGFSEPIIHSFNKHETAVSKDAQYFVDLSHRNNVILLGDSLGDVTMAEGVQNIGTLLRIGFFNHSNEEHLESYLDAFDVVLMDDLTMDFFYNLVKLISVASSSNSVTKSN